MDAELLCKFVLQQMTSQSAVLDMVSDC